MCLLVTETHVPTFQSFVECGIQRFAKQYNQNHVQDWDTQFEEQKMIVRFTRQDLSECEQAASLRWQLARAAKVANQKKDPARSDHDIDLLGVNGELAVARVFQIDHDIHKGGIDKNIDMWDNDVSFDVKATFAQAGHLIFKDTKFFKADVAILVTPHDIPDSVHVAGWIGRKEFIEKAKDIDFGNGACPAMHCDELRQIPELWKFMTIRRVGRLPNKL